ncbi:peptidase M28 [Aliidiomarina sedimenti]|uniref:Peptidase M28 n=1 Tax=Aliidiomarina sedimenti TaxID=1933879 RepID=A0ABY0C2Z0_9GAMM|nr:M28 family metallopeptidase [Aliidiomarina sedimenti]RUO32235.1 peptidase M28 [Aliidiomarina sedimenti]
MFRAKFIAAGLLAASLTACAGYSGGYTNSAEPQAREDAVRAHMKFLADDLLEGRDTGSRGHDIASAYIAAHFEALGLAAYGEDDYYQWMPARQTRLVANSASFVVHKEGNEIELEYPKAFFTGPSAAATEQSITAEMVFVGYGLVSDTFAIDDYAGLDVDGKIVVMLNGRPEHLPSEEAAHLSRLKTELAADRGAVGIVTLHTPEREAVRPYETSLMYLNAPSVRWLNEAGEVQGHTSIEGSAYLHYEAADVLFEGAAQSWEDVLATLEQKESPQGFALPGQATLARQSTHEELQSPNVIAVLEGSDPELKDEYVVYTAHSDHLGLARDMSTDNKVFNGLLDNASGVAIMLETARMFAEAKERGEGPRRSVMFVALTAEEKGLLGADYFAENPPVPASQMVANVNLDMPVLLYPFADVVAFGSAHSSLGDVVERAAGRYGIDSSPDPMPEQAIFTRSDHYMLVKRGIPAVFLMTGFTSQDEEEDGGAVWGQFFAEQYHRPMDDIPSLTEAYGEIRYDFGALFAQINYAIGEEIANTSERPYWLDDSYFGNLFRDDDQRQRH